MSYSVTNPQPPLQPGETAVTLDSGDIVAIAAICSVESASGNTVVAATARVINADGTNKLDAIGQSMTTAFQHTSNTDEISANGIAVVQKCCLMAVLGESTAPLWQDPIHATALATASIRTNIASAAHAGPVDAAALL